MTASIMFGVVLFLTVNIVTGISGRCSINPSLQRAISSASFPMSHIWSARLFVDNGSATTPLVSTTDALIVGKFCNKVVSLDIATGEIMWFSTSMRTPTSIIADDENTKLYVSHSGGISALSISDGTRVWSNESNIFIRNSHPIQEQPDTSLVVYVAGGGFWDIDPDTGQVERLSMLSDDTIAFFDDIAFTRKPGANFVEAINIATGRSLWEVGGLRRCCLSTFNDVPQVLDNLLVLRWNQENTRPVVIDINTGQIVWQATNDMIISNIVVENEIVYALTAKAELLLISAQDGSTLGAIEFEEPEESRLLYQSGAIGGSWLNVKDNRLAIYFQDTNVLSVYEVDLSRL